jgi:hypothetical protein
VVEDIFQPTKQEKGEKRGKRGVPVGQMMPETTTGK